MASSEQLNLRIEPEFARQLEDAADRFGIRGKGTVVGMILETYFDHWRQMQEELLEVRSRHMQNILKVDKPKRRTG